MKIITLLFIALIAALQYRLWFGESNIDDVRAIQAQVLHQKIENEAILLKNNALKAEVKDLKEGYQVIEERARMRLGMISRGEVFYQIVE